MIEYNRINVWTGNQITECFCTEMKYAEVNEV